MFSDWLIVLSFICLTTSLTGALVIWWFDARQERIWASRDARRRVKAWTR